MKFREHMIQLTLWIMKLCGIFFPIFSLPYAICLMKCLGPHQRWDNLWLYIIFSYKWEYRPGIIYKFTYKSSFS